MEMLPSCRGPAQNFRRKERGKPLSLVKSTIDCPYYNTEIPGMQELFETFSPKIGLFSPRRRTFVRCSGMCEKVGARHLPPVQAIVKMVNAPQIVIARALCARGNLGGGTTDSYRLPLKWYAPIASVAAVSDRHWQLQISGHHRRPHTPL